MIATSLLTFLSAFMFVNFCMSFTIQLWKVKGNAYAITWLIQCYTYDWRQCLLIFSDRYPSFRFCRHLLPHRSTVLVLWWMNLELKTIVLQKQWAQGYYSYKLRLYSAGERRSYTWSDKWWENFHFGANFSLRRRKMQPAVADFQWDQSTLLQN